MPDTATRPAATTPACTCFRTFPATPGQVSQARRFLATFLGSCPAAGDAVLCLSELVSNAVSHSLSSRPGGRFTVRATLTARMLRVDVGDDGGPWQHYPATGELHGRGLVIVAAMAHWGITGDGTGPRTVWFQMPC